MLEQDGTLASWRKWDMPNFRERERRTHENCIN
jgi:hypothetical protein